MGDVAMMFCIVDKLIKHVQKLLWNCLNLGLRRMNCKVLPVHLHWQNSLHVNRLQMLYPIKISEFITYPLDFSDL